MNAVDFKSPSTIELYTKLTQDLAMASLKKTAPAMNRAQRRKWFKQNKKQFRKAKND